MMLRTYTSWNEYKKDLDLRDKLERDLTNVRLKSRMMKANPAQQVYANNEIKRILSLVQNLPSRRDQVNFLSTYSSIPYSNSPLKMQSSSIKGLLYNPLTNMISLRLPNKSYFYNMTFNHLKNFLRYYSLGRYYNNKIQG